MLPLLPDQAARQVGKVEHGGNLGLTAVHDDGDLVHRLEPYGIGFDSLDERVIVGILHVDDVGGRAAAKKCSRNGQRNKYLLQFHII